MSILQRLVLPFAALVLLAFLAALLIGGAAFNMSRLQVAVAARTAKAAEGFRTATRAVAAAQDVTREALEMTRLIDPAQISARFDGNLARAREALAGIATAQDDAALGRDLSALDSALAAWEDAARRRLGLSPAVAIPTQEALDRARLSLAAALEAVETRLLAAAETATRAAGAAFERMLLVLVGVFVALAVALAAFALRSVLGIGRVLARLAGVMRSLSQGDAVPAIPGTERRDEIGAMAAALLVFRDALAERTRLAAAEAEASARRLARAERTEAFQADMRRAVAAAAEGAFGDRIATNWGEPDLDAVAGDLNRLLASVESGLAAARDLLAAMARADLATRMEGEFKGAFAELGAEAERMADGLGGRVSDIRLSVRAALALAEGLRARSVELAESAAAQAASIETTAATMAELAGAVELNAQSSASARAIAEEATGRAARGQGIMTEAIEAAAAIDERSRRITDIIGVIEGIAFQTNLLALNAAVEAARAGESGKGFAVVAAEVRTLAQRSSEAARDIKGLIVESTASTARGLERFRGASAALEEIRHATEALAGKIADLAGATREQAQGVANLTRTVGELDQMTRRTAGVIGESAATTGELAREVAGVEDLVAVFRVRQPVGVAAQRAAPSPSRMVVTGPARSPRVARA